MTLDLSALLAGAVAGYIAGTMIRSKISDVQKESSLL